jgi:hypothetical protein
MRFRSTLFSINFLSTVCFCVLCFKGSLKLLFEADRPGNPAIYLRLGQEKSFTVSCCFLLPARVARWYMFKPKIQIWVNFGGCWNEKAWYIVWPLGIFYGHLAVRLINIW